MGQKAPSLACGTGGWVATPTENFSYFHFHFVVKNIKIRLLLAWPSCLLTIHLKCSSVTINIQNLTKLQDVMSDTLCHTFHGKIQPYN